MTVVGRSIAAAVSLGLFAFAFMAAPRSCEGGLSAYVWSGVVALGVLLALPLLVERDRPLGRRIAAGCGYAAIAIAAWVAGLFAADFQILCRLF